MSNKNDAMENEAMAKIMSQVSKDKVKPKAKAAEKKELKGGSSANSLKKSPEIESSDIKEKKTEVKKFATAKSLVVKETKREVLIGEAEVDNEIVDIYEDTGSKKQFYFVQLEHGSLMRKYL